jgi:hypothetical protein
MEMLGAGWYDAYLIPAHDMTRILELRESGASTPHRKVSALSVSDRRLSCALAIASQSHMADGSPRSAFWLCFACLSNANSGTAQDGVAAGSV